jgi:hypothetical protein
MPIKITPRRSVTIDARDAKYDDFLRVTLSDEKVYYVRAGVPHGGMTPRFWFDLEFMPEDYRECVRFVVKSELELKDQESHGYSISSSGYRPSESEVDQELAINHNSYIFETLDYDLPLTVDIAYATTKVRQWASGGHVTHIEWVTRDQVYSEVATVQQLSIPTT